MPLKKIVIGVILFFLLIIILQNLTVVDVKFLFWKISINLLLVILLPFLAGTVMGWFFSSFFRKRQLKNKKDATEKSQVIV